MKERNEKWSDLDLKSRIAYVTAIVAFVIGWGLTIAGMLIPPLGVISDSVLWVLGQALVYAASVFGVGLYVTGSVRVMKDSIRRFMRDEADRYRSGNIEVVDEEIEEDI